MNRKCNPRNQRRFRLKSEEGSQLIELAFVLPVLLLVFAGAVDFGRAWFMYMEVASAAEAGALYGITNATDTTGMKAAAQLDAPDLSTLSSTATYGTECSDGSSPVALNGTPPACGVGVVQYVEVDTAATYQPLLPYPGFQSVFTMYGKSRMRASYQ